ncbi:chemotaxis protein CheX [Candidatus Sumerlaeota bacterium]|nr:chemotaxis protein CheX [Candidatus Sumerlaeota bacterium]
MTELNEHMIEAICDVLEKLAFMFGENAEKEELSEPPEQAFQGEIEFTGDVANGNFGLIVPESMCRELAVNMLGKGPGEEVTPDDSKDAIQETLNVICGQLLTRAAGDQPVFNLSVPKVEVISGQQWNALAQDEKTSALLIDDYPVLAYCKFERTN